MTIQTRYITIGTYRTKLSFVETAGLILPMRWEHVFKHFQSICSLVNMNGRIKMTRLEITVLPFIRELNQVQIGYR